MVGVIIVTDTVVVVGVIVSVARRHFVLRKKLPRGLHSLC